jgi:hypothetical protein
MTENSRRSRIPVLGQNFCLQVCYDAPSIYYAVIQLLPLLSFSTIEGLALVRLFRTLISDNKVITVLDTLVQARELVSASSTSVSPYP